MPSKDPAQRFENILQNITRIRSHTEGMDELGFLEDDKSIDAVERCIERIAEAVRKIGDQFDMEFPDLDLPSLRQFGSVLRHDYDSVQPVLVWGFVRDRLDPLENMARKQLERLSTN